jgi:hypothetical protein
VTDYTKFVTENSMTKKFWWCAQKYIEPASIRFLARWENLKPTNKDR